MVWVEWATLWKREVLVRRDPGFGVQVQRVVSWRKTVVVAIDPETTNATANFIDHGFYAAIQQVPCRAQTGRTCANDSDTNAHTMSVQLGARDPDHFTPFHPLAGGEVGRLFR